MKNNMPLSSSNSKILLYLWVSIYAILWICGSYFLDPTVPYDAVEAVNWGMNGEWGSPKNPWFVGAVMWPAIYLNLSYSFYWYFIHFVGIAIGMIGVWQLAYRLSHKIELAWFALLILNLSGIINFDIIPYNDNYILVTLWPWVLLFFLRAVYDHPKWWLAFALVSGLATMGKYSTLALVGTVFLLTLFVPKVRKSYQQPLFYIAIALWFALILPNLFWLLENDFSAFKWVDSQIEQGFNLHVVSSTLSVFYPLVIATIILYLLGGKIGWPKEQPNQLVNFILLLPLAVIFGWFLFHDGGRMTEWLQPFMMIAAPLFIGSISISPKKSLRKTFFGLIIIGGLIFLGYCLVLNYNIRGAGQKMIGIKALTAEGQQRWRQKYGQPLKYVGGEDNLYQWFIIYASDRPHTIQPWDSSEDQPPNVYYRDITAETIKKHGALLLGRKGKDCSQENFTRMSKHWPQFTIKKEAIIYQSEPNADPQSMCLGFIAPEKNYH